MTEPNCLICCSTLSNTTIEKESKDTLSDQIKTIFIFRNLLQAPESVCETYLSKYGNPSKWINTCIKCSLLVDQALFVNQQINQLQKRLHILGVKVRNEIRESYRPRCQTRRSKERIESHLSVTQETQDFISKQGIEEEEEELDMDFQLQEIPFDDEVPNNSEEGKPFNFPEDPLGSQEIISEWHDLDADGSIKEEIEDDCHDEDYRVSDEEAGSSDDEVTFPNITNVRSHAEHKSKSPKTRTSVEPSKSTTKEVSDSNSLVFQCDVCDRISKDARSLRHHRKNVHNIYLEQERNPLESDKIDDSNKKTAKCEIINEPKIDENVDNIKQPKAPIPKVYKRKIAYRKFRRHCEVCNIEFPTLKELFSHRKEVHNLIPLGEKPPFSDQCEFCLKKFSIYSSLRKHRLGVHGIRERVYVPIKKKVDRPWKCNDCTETFQLDTERDEHEKNVHNEGQETSKLFNCLICIKKYRVKSDLVLHYDMEHKPKPTKSKDQRTNDMPMKFVCEKCPLRFVSEDKLNAHALRVHLGDPKPLKCTVCGKGHKNPGGLRKHMQVHTGTRDFSCEICGKTFTCSTLVVYHKFKEHDAEDEDKPNPLRCTQCKKVFSTKTYLRLHINTIHEKKFRHCCEKCGQGFQSLSNLRVHLLTHEKSNKRKKYSTEKRREKQRLELEKKREAEINLQSSSSASATEPPLTESHQEESEDESDSQLADISQSTKIYRCEICPKVNSRKYTNEEDFQRHVMKYHEGDKKPFKCKQCDQGCHSAGSLRLHMQTHTGERLFACDECDDSFSSSTYLTYHKNKEHTEQGQPNPLECDICKKVLASKSNLRMHIASVHEKTFKFTCDTCGIGFQTQCYLKNHLKVHTNSKRKEYTYTKKPVRGIQLIGNPEIPMVAEDISPVPVQHSTSTIEENSVILTQPSSNPSEFDILQSCIDFSTQF